MPPHPDRNWPSAAVSQKKIHTFPSDIVNPIPSARSIWYHRIVEILTFQDGGAGRGALDAALFHRISGRRLDETEAFRADGLLTIRCGPCPIAPFPADTAFRLDGLPAVAVDLRSLPYYRAAPRVAGWIRHTPIRSLLVHGPDPARDPIVQRLSRTLLDDVLVLIALGASPIAVSCPPALATPQPLGAIIARLSLRERIAIARLSRDEIDRHREAIGNLINNRLRKQCHEDIGYRLWHRLRRTHRLRPVP